MPSLINLFHEHDRVCNITGAGVQRRLLLLIAAWLPVKLTDNSRQQLYRLLLLLFSCQYLVDFRTFEYSPVYQYIV